MNDRELLELAARAIGGSHLEVYNIGDRHGVSGYFPEHPNSLTYWNPLADDGDALRLAMALELGVVCKRESDPYERNSSVVTDPYRAGQLRIVEKHNGNPEASTRRAIVRAAAEIGHSM